MIIHLEPDLSLENEEKLKTNILQYGFKINHVKTQFKAYLVCTGGKNTDIRRIGSLYGVADVHNVSESYQLVSRKWKVKPTEIDLGDSVSITEGEMAIIAGPCSIESDEQVAKVIAHLVKNNIKMMRGGVYKPRSSPYAFRGVGIEGLKTWYEQCKPHGIKIVSEVMQVSQIEPMLPYVDIFQVGARNSQNFNLLDELGKVDKPVMLKRGMSMTIDELLHSAEYVFANGNEKLILCERGIRTFENAYRNTLDLNAIPILKEKSHLPVIADPSHGIGIRRFVAPMALAGIFAGADGVVVEVHDKPEIAFSDGQQTLNFAEAETLYQNVRTCHNTYKQLV